MREIKFRGKCAITGKWAYGFYYPSKGHSIIRDEEDCECIVLPESVGQFTGLYDKNGKEIYEGDILDFDAWEWNRASFKDKKDWEYPKWAVEWDNAEARWNTGGGTTRECPVYKSVVGNIHENPEIISD